MEIHFSEIIYIFALGIILYIILKKQLFDPIGKILEEREGIINDSQSVIADAQVKIEKNREKLDKALSDTSTQVWEIHEKARDEGFDTRKELIKSAQTEAHEMLSSARDEISKASQDVIIKLEKDADAFAREIAGTILGKKIS